MTGTEHPDAPETKAILTPGDPANPKAPLVIGMTAYNGQAFVAETLRSLLDQAWGDFRLVILDDASSDETLSIILREVADDPRVFVYRHEARQGMIATWRDVFFLARRAAPQARWFAWASDHDVFQKECFGRLYGHAKDHPEAACIYPGVLNISVTGKVHPTKPAYYENREPDPIRRFDSVQVKGNGFGNIIYGLLRIDMLEQAGVFRRVLAPDRLTVLELSLMGELHQVKKAVRLRRKTGAFSIERQRRSLFGPGGPPAYSRLTFFLPHAALILKHHLARGGAAWKAGLLGAVGHMVLDQSWRQTVGKWRKDRERAAARAAKNAGEPAAT